MKRTKKKSRLLLAFNTFIFSILLYTNCMSQTDFDKKLKSLLSESVPFMYQDELKHKLDSVNLLDSRSEEEFTTSHIPGAKYVGYDDFDEKSVQNLDREKPVVIYCSVGYRSEKIGEKLQEMGFKEVYNLWGGIFDWKNNGHEVVNESGVTDSVHTYNKSWSKWLKKGQKVY